MANDRIEEGKHRLRFLRFFVNKRESHENPALVAVPQQTGRQKMIFLHDILPPENFQALLILETITEHYIIPDLENANFKVTNW